ncbi:MAG: glycosidase, partial [Bacteroidia bacterium]|nr:glycosidase [Bacteroidia bacterium]
MKNIVIIFLSLIILSGCKEATSELKITNKKVNDWALLDFVKADSINPILKPTPSLSFTCPLNNKEILWEERNVLNPSAIVKDDKVYMFYRAQDLSGTSRIGMAVSTDGLHFEKSPTPVFYPDEDEMKVYEWNYKKGSETTNSEDCYFCYFDGVEDPRIVESEDGTYFLTYTSYD